MNLLECLRVALRGLASNKMRTSLTMLGIIIGVAVVILVVAIGQGAAERVTETINSLGTNLLTLMPGAPRMRANAITKASNAAAATPSGTTTGAVGMSTTTLTSTNRLTLKDAELIAKNFNKTVEAVAPQARANVQIRFRDNNATTTCYGATTDYPYVNNESMMKGRYFTDYEVEGNQKVCVCGITIADKLTNDIKTDLTGQMISINRVNFKVIGMLTPKGAGAWGQDQDDLIIIPITTALRRVMNKTYIDSIAMRCVSQKMMPLAQEQVENFLRIRHHLQPPFPDNDDFIIRSQTQLLESQQSVTNTMTSLLSAVAVISLVVGGIGIMNIMLVSVTERTREIGIRKAIGATPRDIMLQFLIESAIISLLGGLIGIVFGVVGSVLLSTLGGWNAIVNHTAVIAAVVVSAGVGLFFGIYPASKAAQLHPIEALRYE
jgi:putative ABC transport system permease protein